MSSECDAGEEAQPDDGKDRLHVDAAKGADTIGVVQLRTWQCKTHRQVMIEGAACPQCGKQQLLD